MGDEETTPRNRVAQILKTGTLLSLVIIRVNPLLATQDEKSQDIEKQVDRLVDTLMSQFEKEKITFVHREDIPAAFGNA